MDCIRVRLDLSKLSFRRSELNPQCWFLVNRGEIKSVLDLKAEICRRFDLQNYYSALKIYLQGYEILPDESIRILREDDALEIKCDIGNREALFDVEEAKQLPHQKIIKRRKRAKENDDIDDPSANIEIPKKKKRKENNGNISETEVLDNVVDSEIMKAKKRKKTKKKYKKNGNISDSDMLNCFDLEIKDFKTQKRKKKKKKSESENLSTGIHFDVNEFEKQRKKKEKKQKNGRVFERETFNNCFDSETVISEKRKENKNVNILGTGQVFNGNGLVSGILNTNKFSENETKEISHVSIDSSHSVNLSLLDESVSQQPQRRNRKRIRNRKKKSPLMNDSSTFNESISEPKKLSTTPFIFNPNFRGKVFTRNKHIHFDRDVDHELGTTSTPVSVLSKSTDFSLSEASPQGMDNKKSPDEEENEESVNEVQSSEGTKIGEDASNKKTKEEEKQPRNYAELPNLIHPPRSGDLIAFKELVLSESYSPEVSDYKEGKVISCDSAGNMEIELTEELIKPNKTGKFEIDTSEDKETNTVKMVKLNFSSLIEPKIISFFTVATPMKWAALNSASNQETLAAEDR